MRRLPGFLLATGVIILVLMALLISGLRVILPQLNAYRPQLLATIQSAGIPIEIDWLDARWDAFGPTIELHGGYLQLPHATLRVKKVTLALDVWQSLLRWRWQFRKLTFWQLELELTTPLTENDKTGNDNNELPFEWRNAMDSSWRQLDYLSLRDSRVAFLAHSGARTTLDISQFTLLNSSTRHRAEGKISLATVKAHSDKHQSDKHQSDKKQPDKKQSDAGVVQIRMDLDGSRDTLTHGTIYIQADNIDALPWIPRQLYRDSRLKRAQFSLTSWLTVKNGMIFDANVLLQKGQAVWQTDATKHQFAADNFLVQIQRQDRGWRLHAPALNLATDGHIWPKGSLSALWLPVNRHFIGADSPEEVRIRATELQLARISPLLSALRSLIPEITAPSVPWSDLRLQGRIETLALDIPLAQPAQTRFQAKWQEVSWQQWKQLPGIDHFSGTLTGALNSGRLTLNLNHTTLPPYSKMFRAPLAITQSSGALQWLRNENGWELWSDELDIQAKSHWLNGNFRYQQPRQGQPDLAILAGIRLYNAAEAWRYFPQSLMDVELSDYLSTALKGGRADNASLIYNGNPGSFPYKNNEGHFQVYVPLRNAIFQFQSDWPTLTDLAINLDFINDGLWMSAPKIMLGHAAGSNIRAVISDYVKEKLVIDADIIGDGGDIRDYFMRTPLRDSVGAALEELQVRGNVSGRLHLDIPLTEGETTQASGDVTLENNTILIKPLNNLMEKVSGKFRFKNGNLHSDRLSAIWYGQPLSIDFTTQEHDFTTQEHNFTTQEQQQAYRVDLGLQGSWLAGKLPGLPPFIANALAGSTLWQGKVALRLPENGKTSYVIDINSDFKKVSSHLPAPLAKKSGRAWPLKIQATGDADEFMLTASAPGGHNFNSQWTIKNRQARLLRAMWQTGGEKPAVLPAKEDVILNIPPLDGEPWLALLAPAISAAGQEKGRDFMWPERMTLHLPELRYAGQSWQHLSLYFESKPDGAQLTARGKQIDGALFMSASTAPWRADIRYLDYNPHWPAKDNPGITAQISPPLGRSQPFFNGWPALVWRCQECRIMGKNLQRIEANITPFGESLRLEKGVIDIGVARLSVSGQWQPHATKRQTELKGKLSGPKFDQSAAFLGISMPLKDTPFNLDFDLNWHDAPWKLRPDQLNGSLVFDLGKGQLDNAGRGGTARQLLRLVSFDALLRKLQLDFTDIFGKDFYYDSIRGSAKIDNGVLYTKKIVIDGLSADITLAGAIDLVQRHINMEAVIAPEISATVGVATAFINPIAGAALFAATKTFAPLWSNLVLIRYQITGSLAQPEVHEVLRRLKRSKTL